MPRLSSWGLLCTGREGHRFKPQCGQALFHELHLGGWERMPLHSGEGCPRRGQSVYPDRSGGAPRGASPWVQGRGEGCEARVLWG